MGLWTGEARLRRRALQRGRSRRKAAKRCSACAKGDGATVVPEEGLRGRSPQGYSAVRCNKGRTPDAPWPLIPRASGGGYGGSRPRKERAAARDCLPRASGGGYGGSRPRKERAPARDCLPLSPAVSPFHLPQSIRHDRATR